MSVPSLEELERQLSALPREAWDLPVPPPPPWPAEPEPEPKRAARRRRLLVLRPLAAAALSLSLLAAGLGAGLLLGRGDDRAPGQPGAGSLRVELGPVGDGDGRAGGVVTLKGGAGGSATVRLAGLAPSERDEFYELWLLGADGELVSLGSVRVSPSGRAELSVPLPVDPSRFTYLDVSREPADGDPGHSTDSVLRGPTT